MTLRGNYMTRLLDEISELSTRGGELLMIYMGEQLSINFHLGRYLNIMMRKNGEYFVSYKIDNHFLDITQSYGSILKLYFFTMASMQLFFLGFLVSEGLLKKCQSNYHWHGSRHHYTIFVSFWQWWR